MLNFLVDNALLISSILPIFQLYLTLLAISSSLCTFSEHLANAFKNLFISIEESPPGHKYYTAFLISVSVKPIRSSLRLSFRFSTDTIPYIPLSATLKWVSIDIFFFLRASDIVNIIDSSSVLVFKPVRLSIYRKLLYTIMPS